MTRFARAKGSKSSNEKKPEEATSWLEMKRAMLSKPTNRPEEEEAIEKNNADSPSQSEWASLGDDGNSRYLSQQLSKKVLAGKFDTSKVESKKKKKKASVQAETKNFNNESDSIASKKKKKKKPKSLVESENVNNDSNSVAGKKKKKKKVQVETENVKNNLNSVISKKKKKKLKGGSVQEGSSKPNKKGKKRKIGEVDEDSGEVVKKKKLKSVKTNPNTGEGEIVKKKKKLKKKKLSFSENESVSSKPTKNPSKNAENESAASKKKKVKNKPFKYDKTVVEELIVNGKTIPIVKFQGFNVMQEDAERLKDLRNEMLKQGIPKEKLEAALKLERRRAEKALSRLKKAVCFHCRGIGHLLSDCPNLKERENTGTGICYKCGSTEHLAVECKVVKGTNFAFAECFICKEQGHIARQCPDNPRGLYPQGGACRECGDVTHLRKDCPQVASKKSEEIFTVRRNTDGNLECLDEEIASKEKQKAKPVKKKSAVKF